MGVLFNDSTRLILYNDGDSLQYIERDGTESYLTVSSHPNSLMKKITLLNYFRNYMSEHLLKAGANITPREGDELARLPYLRTWFRTRSAIILHLSNGTVQINFFQVCRRRGLYLGWQCCLFHQWGAFLTFAPPLGHQLSSSLAPSFPPRTTPNLSCAP